MSLSPPPSRDKLPVITEGGRPVAEMSRAWIKWFTELKDLVAPVATGGLIVWNAISKAGSNLTDLTIRNHADLQNVNSSTYTHLTQLNHTDLTDGGNTILHKHTHNLQDGLQGGGVDDYIHLTTLEHSELTDGGQTTIHSHPGLVGIVEDGQDGEIVFLPAMKNNNPLDYSLIGQLGTCLISGGVLSVNANPALFNIAAADLHFIDGYTNTDTPTFKEVHYAGSTGNSVTNLATQDSTYISIDVNGTIIQDATKPSGSNIRDKILLGALVHTNRTSITSADSTTDVVGYNVPNTLADLSLAIGPINSGNVLSGNAVNTLRINKTIGYFIQTGINWKNDKKNPNIITAAASTGAAFLITWRNGTGGWTTAVKTDIIPGRYDDGTGGATQPNGVVLNNKWSLLKWYYLPNSQIIGIEFGQVVYNSLADAEANKSTATIDNPALESIPFRGWIAVRGGATNLTLAADAEFIDAGKFGSLTSGAGAGALVPTMQNSYDNSVQPQIVTSTALGAVQIKRGSAADTDVVFEVLNGAGTAVFQVTGLGVSGTGVTLAQARALATLRV